MIKIKTKKQMNIYISIFIGTIIFILWTFIYVQSIKMDFINELEIKIGERFKSAGFEVRASGNTIFVKSQETVVISKNEINISDLEKLIPKEDFDLVEAKYIEKFGYEHRLYQYNKYTYFSKKINVNIKKEDANKKRISIYYSGLSSRVEDFSWLSFFGVFMFGMYNLDRLIALWKK